MGSTRAMAVSVAMVGILLLWGCSPAFNWRQVRAEGSSVSVLLPCKPERASRTVPWAGSPDGRAADLAMLSCDVGDLTFAAGFLRLPDGVAVTQAMEAWKKASLASMRASAPSADVGSPVWPGRASGIVTAGWQASGARHDGRPVQARALMLGTSDEVVQVVVYGPVPAEIEQNLWEGVQVTVPP